MMFNRPCPCEKPKCEREIIEPTVTSCVEKEFYHEVKQDCQLMLEKSWFK